MPNKVSEEDQRTGNLASQVSGPKFFSKYCCDSSSSGEHSSDQVELALPGSDGTDDESSESGGDEPTGGLKDRAFEAMMEPFDPDAFQAEIKAPEATIAEKAEVKVHEDVGKIKEEIPLAESKARRDLRIESVSLQHLLSHLPKNPYCVSCQQAKMRQRYSHKGAFKRDIDQFGEILTLWHQQ